MTNRNVKDRKSSFVRGLSEDFLRALEQLATDDIAGRWWQDILARRDLVLAVRNEALNVYHSGASLFQIAYRNGRVAPSTHIKYLVRQRQAYAFLSDRLQFSIDAGDVVHESYEGPQTLQAMIAATKAYVGAEKAGLHPLILASPNVIDVEISLERLPEGNAAPIDDGEGPEHGTSAGMTSDALSRAHDRVDAVSLEKDDQGGAVIAFHEAKNFMNPELTAWNEGTPAVVAQIERYRRSIAHHRPALLASYKEVCRALVRLDALRMAANSRAYAKLDAPASRLDPLIGQVARGEIALRVDPQPRLIVYGFDADQRDGSLKKIRDRLQNEYGLIIYAVGNPKGVKATPAFQSLTTRAARREGRESGGPIAPAPSLPLSA
jgi:hypothetical protein